MLKGCGLTSHQGYDGGLELHLSQKVQVTTSMMFDIMVMPVNIILLCVEVVREAAGNPVWPKNPEVIRKKHLHELFGQLKSMC